MENASKALIIAGAILLSILLISLGLIVYNQARETIGSVNLSQQEIEAFNSKFSSFEGTNVSGTKVNQLIQTVIASNQQAINDSTGANINIQFPSVSGENVLIGNNKYTDKSTCTNVNAIVLATPTAATTSYSLKVIPGLKYTVEFGYTKSRVSGIYVHQ